MLMVNDRRFYSDTFWFTLFHEIGHIINGDYGITFENEHAGQEDAADKYALKLMSLAKMLSDLLKELTEIRVLSLAACKMIRLFHLQMLHCQKH